MTKKIKVERHLEQVVNGSQYKGYVKIAGTQLDYELVFGIPISSLDKVEPAKSHEEFRRLFKVTMKLGDGNIELTSDEYLLFVELLGSLAIDFHDHPQTRANNEGLAVPLVERMGGSLSFSIDSPVTFDATPELCAMLSAPKFGVSLAA